VLKRRTKPTWGELELLRLVGAGFTVKASAVQLGISPHTAHDRVRRLKFLSGQESLPAMVYWGLRQRYLDYDYPVFTQGLVKPAQTQIISRLALDQSEKEICKHMRLTDHQVQAQIKLARRYTKAKSRSHLVAIAWMEGWIV
jgi:DNA-binding CsgD family transcriptional regulator